MFWNEDQRHAPPNVHFDVLAPPVCQAEGDIVDVAGWHFYIIKSGAVVVIDEPPGRLIDNDFACDACLSHRPATIIVHPQ